MRAGSAGQVVVAINTISKRNRDAGFDERLRAGDWIALTGSADAVRRAREYLDSEQRADSRAR